MASTQQPQENRENDRVAIGGVFTRQAGCLLIPFLPVRAAGALIVSTSRIVFDPILHYKLFAKKREFPLEEVARAESSGENVGISMMEFVTFGKNLRLFFKDGRSQVFRSTQADELAEVINALIEGRPVPPSPLPVDTEEHPEGPEDLPPAP